MYVLEVQNHILALNAITQKAAKYHHGYVAGSFNVDSAQIVLRS